MDLPDRAQEDKGGIISFLIQGKITKRLFILMLVISLVPLIMVSIISYQSTHSTLRQSAVKALSATAVLKAEYIKNFIFERMTDLSQQAGLKENRYFLKLLESDLEKSGLPIDEYVKSENWDRIIKVSGDNLKNFKKNYGCYDVFLINTQGDILFSVMKENDLGTNLSTGKYRNTLFAKACSDSLEQEKPVFSDMELYEPSNNLPASFMVQVMLNERKEKVGLIAIQFPITEINKIMQDRTGLGNTGETYLVGADLVMRSDSIFELRSTVLRRKVDTVGTGHWLKNEKMKHKGVKMPHILPGERKDSKKGYIYSGYRGIEVMGVFQNIDGLESLGIRWAVVAEMNSAEAFKEASSLRNIFLVLFEVNIVIVLLLAFTVTKNIVGPIKQLSDWALKVAKGDLETVIEIKSKDEIGQLADSFKMMTNDLKEADHEKEKRDWLKTGQVELGDRMRGEQDLTELSHNIISFLAGYLNAQIGVVYLKEENDILRIIGSYAYPDPHGKAVRFGEGLIGEAALERKSLIITGVPDGYSKISSGWGEAVPHNILVVPFFYNGEVTGVIELGSFEKFSGQQLELLKLVAEPVAVAFNTNQASQRTQELLERTQAQSEELQAQQEELRASNEELEEHTRALTVSEARLQAQQEELRANNEELEERSGMLERQKKNIQQKNLELEKAHKLIEQKAHELELSSKYKSEFLANMSHELRTPLNSLLILSSQLASNPDGNLTGKQIEYARTVHESGSDLLVLINEILDLSKVEAGKMELHLEDVFMEIFSGSIKRSFLTMAEKKGLYLRVNLVRGLPEQMYTDSQRTSQIIKNLLSNALKFTGEGGITVTISRPSPETVFFSGRLNIQKTVAFAVSDTGAGIPPEKQKIIFEAFKQADGSTSRKYGGTGLGLSISKELARLLGGEIHLQSEEGKGSTFTLYLPDESTEKPTPEKKTEPEKPPSASPAAPPPAKAVVTAPPVDVKLVRDDRKDLQLDDKSILIIEDDPIFGKILLELAHKKGFKGLVAEDGETGLQFADYYRPDAIILDISLPGIDGWAVMKRLKENPDTWNIPVHFMSGLEKSLEAMKMGAIGFFTKPVSMKMLEEGFMKIEKALNSKIQKLLVVMDDEEKKDQLLKMVKGGGVKARVAATGLEAFERLQSGKFDCLILDPHLADGSGFELLEKIKQNHISLPIIIYTGKKLTGKEENKFLEYARSMVIKKVDSSENLMEEAALFLHIVEANLPLEKQKNLKMIHHKEEILKGRKILLIDDDVRNVFALASVLGEKGIKIIMGKNGKEGLELLNNNPDTDLVLMDIMMPVMDGYQATRKIRKQERFKKIPIIAITAKAMKGDRDKCLRAGANDYIVKPIDTGRLISLLKVWMYKEVQKI